MLHFRYTAQRGDSQLFPKLAFAEILMLKITICLTGGETVRLTDRESDFNYYFHLKPFLGLYIKP